MTCYSIKCKNRIFVKACEDLPFVENMSKSIGKKF